MRGKMSHFALCFAENALHPKLTDVKFHEILSAASD